VVKIIPLYSPQISILHCSGGIFYPSQGEDRPSLAGKTGSKKKKLLLLLLLLFLLCRLVLDSAFGSSLIFFFKFFKFFKFFFKALNSKNGKVKEKKGRQEED